MGRRLGRTIILADKVTGTPTTYLAGTEVDDETAARITNPKVWEADSSESVPAPDGGAAAEGNEPEPKAPAKKTAAKKSPAKKTAAKK